MADDPIRPMPIRSG